MKEDDFLKKVGFYARYLNQYLDEGDIARILEAIRDLEELRKHAEFEGVTPPEGSEQG